MDFLLSEEAKVHDPDPRDRKSYVFHMTLFHRAFIWAVGNLFKLIVSMEVSGRENLPEGGPVILVANHTNNFDVIPMQLSIDRPIFFMAKAELFKNPLIDIAIRDLGAFPVIRGEKDQWALRHALRVLECSLVVGIFPEGARSHGHGLRSAKTGAARIALAARCPIVPMAVDGSHRILKNLPRRTRVSITIGEPIYPDDHESPLALTDRIMFSLANMLPHDLRGVYAERPQGF
jgi:1-acyl-sn-glycerol-3-phosphate acyltransferase